MYRFRKHNRDILLSDAAAPPPIHIRVVPRSPCDVAGIDSASAAVCQSAAVPLNLGSIDIVTIVACNCVVSY